MIPAHDRVLIVCTGPSVTGSEALHLTKRAAACGAWVIAVNGAIDQQLTAHAWFTLDPSAENRARMNRPRAGVTYYAALPDDLTHPIPRHVVKLKRLTGTGPLKAKEGLSDDPAGVHTGNSGYGALGLAYHAQARQVAFLGLDGRQNGYFYGGHGPRGPLDHLPALFASAVPQLKDKGISVVNASPGSSITCFDGMRPADAISWLSAS